MINCECPFCGGKAHIMKMGFPHWIYCEDCGARVHGGTCEEKDSIKAWNRRTGRQLLLEDTILLEKKAQQMEVTNITNLPEGIRDRIQEVLDQRIKISKKVTNGVLLTLLFSEILVSEDRIRDEVLVLIDNQYKVLFDRTWFYDEYQYRETKREAADD